MHANLQSKTNDKVRPTPLGTCTLNLYSLKQERDRTRNKTYVCMHKMT